MIWGWTHKHLLYCAVNRSKLGVPHSCNEQGIDPPLIQLSFCGQKLHFPRQHVCDYSETTHDVRSQLLQPSKQKYCSLPHWPRPSPHSPWWLTYAIIEVLSVETRICIWGFRLMFCRDSLTALISICRFLWNPSALDHCVLHVDSPPGGTGICKNLNVWSRTNHQFGEAHIHSQIPINFLHGLLWDQNK